MASKQGNDGVRNVSGGTDGGVRLHESSPSSASSEGGTPLHDDSPADVGGGSTGVTSPFSSPVGGNSDMTAIANNGFWNAGGHFATNTNSEPGVDNSSPLASREQVQQPAQPQQPQQSQPQQFRAWRPRNGFGNGYGIGRGQGGQGGQGHAGGHVGGYPTSRAWMSPEVQRNQEFIIVRNAMRRLFKNSELAKWKLADYTAHREAMFTAKQAELSKSINRKKFERNEEISQRAASLLPSSNISMKGNRGLALGQQTIWCEDWTNGKDEIAPWPSLAELKWEGEDRAMTSCGRFLPLPREPGAPGIQWCQLQVVEQYPIDQVQLIPTMEDVYLPVDEIDDEVIPNLLNQNLLDALDESL